MSKKKSLTVSTRLILKWRSQVSSNILWICEDPHKNQRGYSRGPEMIQVKIREDLLNGQRILATMRGSLKRSEDPHRGQRIPKVIRGSSQSSEDPHRVQRILTEIRGSSQQSESSQWSFKIVTARVKGFSLVRNERVVRILTKVFAILCIHLSIVTWRCPNQLHLIKGSLWNVWEVIQLNVPHQGPRSVDQSTGSVLYPGIERCRLNRLFCCPSGLINFSALVVLSSRWHDVFLK